MATPDALAEACLGAKPVSYEEEMRARATEVYRGLYGEPLGSLIHVPPYADYKPGDRLIVGTGDSQEKRKCIVLRAAPDLGLIEVVYGQG